VGPVLPLHRGKSPTLVASGRRSGTTTGRTATSRTTSTASSNYPDAPGVQVRLRRVTDG
jgi:hypothetical protein